MVDLCLFFSCRKLQTRCALVTGVQTCALPISCARNAVSNGPVRQNAGDQNAFTFKKTHVVYPLTINKSAVNQPRTCVPGTRSRLPIESLLLFMLLSLRSSSTVVW